MLAAVNTGTYPMIIMSSRLSNLRTNAFSNAGFVLSSTPGKISSARVATIFPRSAVLRTSSRSVGAAVSSCERSTFLLSVSSLVESMML